jgi:2-dehydro-3-deoxygluconokinase
MVEFNQTEGQNSVSYLQGFGGDTSNFLIAAARQGARTGFLTALGKDRYGAMLRQLWHSEGVDDSAVLTNHSAYTAIYFVSHGEQGHQFDFFRKGSAASLLRPVDLNRAYIEQAKVLHISGISLAISETARQTCFEAIAIARKAGVKISFDTNLRLKLWPIEVARDCIEQAISQSDICLPSYDDMTAITGLHDAEAIALHCLNLGAKIVALKMSSDGALLATAGWRERVSAFACRPVDATGAGDTFGGAFVARLTAGDSISEAGRYACAAAALSTEGYGAVKPIPNTEQVKRKLSSL